MTPCGDVHVSLVPGIPGLTQFPSLTCTPVKGPVLLGLQGPVDDPDDSVTSASKETLPGLDSPSCDGDWKELPRHRDEDQVQLDVNRSFIYYPNRMCTRTKLA